jgi:hypothetical protein
MVATGNKARERVSQAGADVTLPTFFLDHMILVSGLNGFDWCKLIKYVFQSNGGSEHGTLE